MLQRGDAVPHFDVTTSSGRRVAYRTIWQHRNLVLIVVPSDPDSAQRSIVADLESRTAELEASNAVSVVTQDSIAQLEPPAALVADRWGEIAAVFTGRVPPADELFDWLDYVQRRCAECEGEAR